MLPERHERALRHIELRRPPGDHGNLRRHAAEARDVRGDVRDGLPGVVAGRDDRPPPSSATRQLPWIVDSGANQDMTVDDHRARTGRRSRSGNDEGPRRREDEGDHRLAQQIHGAMVAHRGRRAHRLDARAGRDRPYDRST